MLFYAWEDFAGRSALSCQRRCASGAVKLGKQWAINVVGLISNIDVLLYRIDVFENPSGLEGNQPRNPSALLEA